MASPAEKVAYFTTSFFHHPDELRAEVAEAGFVDVEVLAIEGLGWAAPDLDDRLRDSAKPSLLGASPHILAVGRTPDAVSS